MIENQIPWGEIGYIVFKRTYSRRLEDNNINSDTEEFEDVINRELNAIDNQLNLKLSDDEIALYKSTRLALKWSVAGRFMWQLGTKTVDELGLTSLQNCFSRKTKFVTSKGIKSFEDFNKGDKVIVKGYTAWKEATIQSFGKQKIYELILKRHSGKEEIIETTKNHRWIINYNSNKKRSIKETIDLQPGMILQQTSLKTNLHNLKMCKVGIQHGLVFGDGHYNSISKCCAFVPCGAHLFRL